MAITLDDEPEVIKDDEGGNGNSGKKVNETDDGGQSGDGGDGGSGSGNGKDDNESGQGDNNGNGTTVDIENEQGEVINYTIDADGNATLDGNVVYTKQQLIDSGFKFETSTTEPTVEEFHKSISSISGVILKDASGNEVTFGDGIEGIAEREVAVKNTFYNLGKQEATKVFLEENPELYDMYLYKQQNGTLDNYTKRIDYSKLIINAETPAETLKSILKDLYVRKGNDSDTADKLVKLSENDETLALDANKALEEIKALDLKNVEAYNQQRALKEKAEEEAFKSKYGVDVDDKGQVKDLGIKDSMYDKIVNQGKIGNLALPKDGITIERDGKQQHLNRLDVFAYFYNPIDIDGEIYTMAQLDEYKRTNNVDNWIVQGIKNLYGNDISALEKALKTTLTINNTRGVLKIVNNRQQQSTIAQVGKKRVVLDD